jgi:hypothetical protein
LFHKLHYRHEGDINTYTSVLMNSKIIFTINKILMP